MCQQRFLFARGNNIQLFKSLQWYSSCISPRVTKRACSRFSITKEKACLEDYWKSSIKEAACWPRAGYFLLLSNTIQPICKKLIAIFIYSNWFFCFRLPQILPLIFLNQLALTKFGWCELYTIDSMVYLPGNEAAWAIVNHNKGAHCYPKTK